MFVRPEQNEANEIVIITLGDSNFYYKTTKIASEIFLILEKNEVERLTLKNIISSLFEKYPEKYHPEIEVKTTEFFNFLVENELVSKVVS